MLGGPEVRNSSPAYTTARMRESMATETTSPEQIPPSITFIAERELRVGKLTTPIRVRIYRREDGTLAVKQSHFLKTAVQYLPHTANPPSCQDVQELFDAMQATLDKFYNSAIGRGSTPSESWLVENSKFAAS